MNGNDRPVTLLIDRAAATEVPSDDAIRNWARDKRAFISSVMAELREERAAAADGIASIGVRPVMFENFGGRDASARDAYLGEIEASQIYIGILGELYGRPLPTRYSATHTEYRHAEQRGLRIAAWALETQAREGPQQSFLDEIRSFHVVPSFRSPDELQRQVSDRIRSIAAEDLSPWAKLGSIVFRAHRVTHDRKKILVTARIYSDNVGFALEATAPGDFDRGHRHRFTWAGRSCHVRVADVKITTTVARSMSIHLHLEVIKIQPDTMLDVTVGGHSPNDLTEAAIRTALFNEPNILAPGHLGFMAEIPDPLQPLRDAQVPDEIVRSLAELMIVENLVGSGRVARTTKFQLGASVKGVRKLRLAWEPPQRYVNQERKPRREVQGDIQLY